MRVLIPLLACLSFIGTPNLTAGDAPKTIQVYARATPREIALNQPVRLEFTTQPRQVEGIDIVSAVSNALVLGGSEDWRILGKPVVNDQDTKSKVITVVVTLLPRSTGDKTIPDIPISWRGDNSVAHVDPVVVQEKIQIAGVLRDLPRETTGVAGWTWGSSLDDAEKRVIPENIERLADRVRVKVESTLTLDYIDRKLGQATMTIPELTLEQARTTFLERWGLPLEEVQGQVRWIIGWTVITAAPTTDAKGTVLTFQREDVLGNAVRSLIRTRVFDVLDRSAAPSK